MKWMVSLKCILEPDVNGPPVSVHTCVGGLESRYYNGSVCCHNPFRRRGQPGGPGGAQEANGPCQQ